MIGQYKFGSVEIDGEVYEHDLIFYRGEVIRWWREKGHKVKVADVQSLLAKRPQLVVFGTGQMGFMRIGKKALAALKEAGIEVVAERTAKAIKRYNDLASEGRDAALAIHLTC